jgi:hypothetical protein
MKTRKPKIRIAAAVGFATAGGNEITQAIHNEIADEVAAMVDGLSAEARARVLGGDEAKARVHAAREKGLRKSGKALREGLRVEEHQQRRRLKAAAVRRTKAATEHAKWIAAFDANARRNPDVLKGKIMEMTARQFGVGASSIRRVVRDR